MIPFRNSLPYDIIMKDVYIPECPCCGSSQILLPIKPEDVKNLRESVYRKLAVVFPCCHTRIQLVDADYDYLLADRPLRGG
jgi:hypothetical protein